MHLNANSGQHVSFKVCSSSDISKHDLFWKYHNVGFSWFSSHIFNSDSTGSHHFLGHQVVRRFATALNVQFWRFYLLKLVGLTCYFWDEEVQSELSICGALVCHNWVGVGWWGLSKALGRCGRGSGKLLNQGCITTDATSLYRGKTWKTNLKGKVYPKRMPGTGNHELHRQSLNGPRVPSSLKANSARRLG